jgi:hypothetical protein
MSNWFYYAVISFFVLSNVITEFINRKALPPFRNPLSAYLTEVKWFQLQDAGYLILAFSLPAMGWYLGGLWPEILMSLSGVALVSVVITKLVIHYGNVNQFIVGDLEKVHVGSAGVAFASITVALLIHSWLTPTFPFICALLAPLSAAAFARFAPNKTPLEEKCYTFFLLIALISSL